MCSDLPKVLHEVCGRPMLGHVLSACRLAGMDRLVAVVGHGKDLVMERFAAERDVTWVEQAEQNGTGHAVACCRESLRGLRGSVVVVAGDMPLIRRETVVELLEHRERTGDALSLATTILDDPMGYGRIVRDGTGQLEAIIEERDCTGQQRAIREVNPSYYCFDSQRLWEALEALRPAPDTHELYLTDSVKVLRAGGHTVSVALTVPPEEAMGINARLDLARAARAMEDRIQLELLSAGVSIVDPDNTWIEADVSIGRDTIIYPFSYVGAGATIGEGSRIGPYAWVQAGERLGEGVVVQRNAGSGVAMP